MFMVVHASGTYITVMYDGRLTFESVTEGMNYAVQTATSVGYGNWESPVFVDEPDEVHKPKVFRLRAWSVLYMLLGGVLYTLVTGVVVSILVERLRPKP